MSFYEDLEPKRKLASILFRLLQNPMGIPVETIKNEYGISDRSFRNYLKDFKEIPDLIGDDGESRVFIEKNGDTRYLKIDITSMDKEKTTDYFAAFYMASSLMNFLSGTRLYEPIGKWVGVLNKKGLKLPIPHLDRKIHAVSEFPKDYTGKDEIIRKVLRAVLDQRKLDIYYEALKGPRGFRSFKPYTLMEYRFGLYLIGVSEDKGPDIIQLAIDRINEVSINKESFQYPADFSPSEYLSKGFGIIHGGKTYNVELVFDKEVATNVKERKYHKTAKIKERRNGSIVLTMTVDSIYQLFTWVLGWGHHVEVKKPKELKDWIKEEAKGMLAIYRD